MIVFLPGMVDSYTGGMSRSDSVASSDQIDLATAPPFRIGLLTVEPALRQVVAASSVTLEPRVMQVLVQLAMANGAIVSRDELVRQCWEGRIVGDDAINRVIARLRRLLDDHGDAAARIETITKVGYRLVGPVVLIAPIARPPMASETPLPAAAPAVAPALPLPDPARRSGWWRVAAMVAVVAVAALVWRVARPEPAPVQASLRIGSFKPLSADVPATLPAQLESELLLKFGETANTSFALVRTPPADKTQAFVVAGSVGTVGNTLRYSFNLSQEQTGQMPISFRLERRIAADAAVASVAIEASRMISCIMHGMTEGRTQPLPDSTVTLFARFCQAASLGLPSRDARNALLREAVADSPDFAYGWATLASNLAGALPESDKVPGKPDYDEAMTALATAQRLGLSSFVIPNTQARLLPSRKIAEREALLRDSARRFATQSNGTAPFNLGNLLWNAGRLTDAIAANRTALQINPNHEEATHFQATMLRWTGQIAGSDAMIRKLDAEWPESGHGRWFKLSDALQRRDFATARAAVDKDRLPAPEAVAAVDAAFLALQSGDAAARTAAGDRLVALNANEATRTGLALDLLAALGRDADALKVAEQLIYGPQVPSTKILFNPALARARALPAFAELAERLGLVDYWRRPGNLPDFCTAAAAPPLCKTLARRN